MKTDRLLYGRRTVLKASAALFAAGMLPSTGSVFSQMVLNRTQDQILGPFYPIMSKPNRTGDLTRVPGSSERAKGQLLIVKGRVIDPTGKPVAGAVQRGIGSRCDRSCGGRKAGCGPRRAHLQDHTNHHERTRT